MSDVDFLHYQGDYFDPDKGKEYFQICEDAGELKHFQDQYYDPVKAHEYYLKTRELKGKEKKAKLTEEQQSGYNYAKGNIDAEKKAVLASTAKAQQEQIAAIRAGAERMRAKIAEDLKALMEKIDAAKEDRLAAIAQDRADKIQKIADDTQKALSAIPPVPKGLPPEEAARRAADRRDEIARIKGDSKTKRQQVAADSAKAADDFNKGVGQLKAGASGTANLTRAKVAEGLKGSIEKAQKNFATLKAAIQKKYEAKYQTEYDAISKHV